MKTIEIVDVTLRDGAQTSGVHFSAATKLEIVAMLLGIGINRIEVASTLVPNTQEETAKIISQFTAYNSLIEILGFVDGKKSVDWIREVGGSVINLLAKCSLRHCRVQLGCKPAEHFKRIEKTSRYAAELGMCINVYLEDWSQGCRNSPGYVRELVKCLCELPVKRLMLCDTLGVLHPREVDYFVKWTKEIVVNQKQLDYHGHNDYGLATICTLAAIEAGVSAVHVTVNGLGERAGNAPLDEVAVGISDLLKEGFKNTIKESRLREVSEKISILSGRRIPANKPISGSSVFTGVAGVHIDGDLKGDLYIGSLNPQRFGRETDHALGLLGGRSSIQSNLRKLGFRLAPRHIEEVIKRVSDLLRHKKHRITHGDLYFVIADVLNKPEMMSFKVLEVRTISRLDGRASLSGRIFYYGKEYSLDGKGAGGFDAFMVGIRDLVKRQKLKMKIPELVDYEVHIPPLGGGTDAVVEAIIHWRLFKEGEFMTSGLSPDQVIAAIFATEAAINIANRGRD